jgi:protein associated with RNAse G/E
MKIVFENPANEDEMISSDENDKVLVKNGTLLIRTTLVKDLVKKQEYYIFARNLVFNLINILKNGGELEFETLDEYRKKNYE